MVPGNNSQMAADYTLIDPPVGPWSTSAQIKAWLTSLEGDDSPRAEESRIYAELLLKLKVQDGETEAGRFLS